MRFTTDRAGGSGKTDIYLAHEIWEDMQPDIDRLKVLLPGYGQFWLCFERSATGG